ncbi:MAG: hypothetical protein H6741_29675, partial [Alphaproteobacteria bacterium]|nr:hypothetical protein [Alphaproteobacteria bacterium]
MHFSEHLAQRIAEHPDAVLVEPARQLRYGDLQTAFSALDGMLSGSGPVLVVCPQSLAGALVTLYLLDRGVDAVLVPAEMTDLDAALASLRFCTRRLELGEPPPEERWFEQPEGFATLTPLQPTATLPDGPPRLFLMTSGSMGQAKLVAHSHARFLGNALACVERFELGPADRV